MTSSQFSVEQICSWVKGRVVNTAALGEKLSQIRIHGASPLTGSKSSDIAFFFSREYQAELPGAKPGVLITGNAFVGPLEKAGLPFWASTAVIAVDDPYLAMALISGHLVSALSTVGHLFEERKNGPAKIHPSSVIDPTAKIGEGSEIGPFCTVGAGAILSEGVILYPHCTVGPSVKIGAGSVLFAGVVIYEGVNMGEQVRIHANTVIGSDGFGYAPIKENPTDPKSKKVVGHQKIYHLGTVVLGDHVEIGASSTVDRGTLGETRIESLAKLDNQVHVGHNAKVGRGAVLCGGVCLAGGAIVDDFAYVGGLTGVTNRIRIGKGANVGAMTLVTKDVQDGDVVVGSPQRPYREHFKVHALLNRMLETRKSDAKPDGPDSKDSKEETK